MLAVLAQNGLMHPARRQGLTQRLSKQIQVWLQGDGLSYLQRQQRQGEGRQRAGPGVTQV
jgi:hypothetical protein